MIRDFIGKYKKSLLVALACVFLGLVIELQANNETVVSEQGSLARQDPGGGDVIRDLRLTIPDLEEDTEYSVNVPENRLDSRGREELFKAVEREIDESFAGENKSLEEVCLPVVMKSSYGDGLVEAEWVLSDYTVMQPDGTIIEEAVPEEGVMLTADAELRYREYTHTYSFPFRVTRRPLTELESIYREINASISDEEKREGSAELHLPEQALGHELVWEEKQLHTGILFAVLGVFAAFVITFSGKSKRNEERKKREQKLLIDYPELVSKLSLLLGAGMTMTGAWERIVSIYITGREAKKTDVKPAYEEMCLTLREIRDGISERAAYEHFGERCGLRQYRKLAALIVQNLRKGSRGLTALMEAEADSAFELRKQLAKKLGEEAGTRLLAPMMLSLGVIVVMIMVPALISFYGG